MRFFRIQDYNSAIIILLNYYSDDIVMQDLDLQFCGATLTSLH